MKFLGVLLRSAVLDVLRCFRKISYVGCGRGERAATQSRYTVPSHCAASNAEARGEDI